MTLNDTVRLLVVYTISNKDNVSKLRNHFISSLHYILKFNHLTVNKQYTTADLTKDTTHMEQKNHMSRTVK